MDERGRTGDKDNVLDLFGDNPNMGSGESLEETKRLDERNKFDAHLKARNNLAGEDGPYPSPSLFPHEVEAYPNLNSIQPGIE